MLHTADVKRPPAALLAIAKPAALVPAGLLAVVACSACSLAHRSPDPSQNSLHTHMREPVRFCLYSIDIWGSAFMIPLSEQSATGYLDICQMHQPKLGKYRGMMTYPQHPLVLTQPPGE